MIMFIIDQGSVDAVNKVDFIDLSRNVTLDLEYRI